MLHSSKVLRDMLPQGKNGISYLRSQKILRCHINLMCRLDWSMRCLDSWCVWEVLWEDTNLSNSRQDASPLEDQGKTVSCQEHWTHELTVAIGCPINIHLRQVHELLPLPQESRQLMPSVWRKTYFLWRYGSS